MKQIKGLDTLRAFAIFFVFVEHCGVWFDTTVFNGRFIKEVVFPSGGFGVVLFFVLSGFLITSILLKEKSATAGNERFTVAKNFFIRRALRIFPIYYLLFLFLINVGYPELKEHSLYYLTYTTNILCYNTNKWNSFSHTWTLCVEEQFYLLWPWFILFVGERYLKYVFIVAIVAGVASTYYGMAVSHHMGPLLVYNCFDAFGLGGLFAYCMQDTGRKAAFQKVIWIVIPFALAAYFYWEVSLFLRMKDIYCLAFMKIVHSIISMWLIMLVVNSRSVIVRKVLLENRFFNFIGKISYGIYLYHYVYNCFYHEKVSALVDVSTRRFPAFHTFVTDSHFMYWLHFVIVVLFSWASFVIVEKPMLRLKKYFNYHRQQVNTVN